MNDLHLQIQTWATQQVWDSGLRILAFTVLSVIFGSIFIYLLIWQADKRNLYTISNSKKSRRIRLAAIILTPLVSLPFFFIAGPVWGASSVASGLVTNGSPLNTLSLATGDLCATSIYTASEIPSYEWKSGRINQAEILAFSEDIRPRLEAFVHGNNNIDVGSIQDSSASFTKEDAIYSFQIARNNCVERNPILNDPGLSKVVDGIGEEVLTFLVNSYHGTNRNGVLSQFSIFNSANFIKKAARADGSSNTLSYREIQSAVSDPIMQSARVIADKISSRLRGYRNVLFLFAILFSLTPLAYTLYCKKAIGNESDDY